MDSCVLQHVSIWLEDQRANEVTFLHALEWAFRLQLPLRVVAITSPPVMDKVKAWGELAELRDVALESHFTGEKTQRAVEQFVRTNGLFVFPNPAEMQIPQGLLQRSAQTSSMCQLRCANTFSPIDRVLVLCHDADLRVAYLESAARLCHALETTPIVLILAESEYDAERKQEYAESTFHSRRMLADVDVVIDRDPAQGVNRVLSWRRCSHVMMSHSSHLVPTLSSAVSVLTLPDAVSLTMPRRIRSSQGLLPWNRSDVFEPV